MAENNINLRRHAMHFGTYMGIYWIAKFILFPLGLSNLFLMLLFFVLTIAVPFIGVHYARSFRDKICGGGITFMQSGIFMIFMYLFASLLAAIAHYIYFRYIDNGYVINTYTQMFEQIKSLPEVVEVFEQYHYQETLDEIRSMSAIEICVQLLYQNMLYCSILALITAPFVTKRKQIVF
jgi:hypothetical protein